MNVLQFEDGKGASRVIQEELRSQNISVMTVQDLPSCLASLEGDRAVTVMIDLDLIPGGLEAVQEIHKSYPDTIVLALASLENLSIVDEALKQGAWDYIVKQTDLTHLDEVSQTITRNQEWKKLRAENRGYQAEKQWLAAALLESPDPIFVADQEGRIVFVNPELQKQLDYQGEDLIGEPIDKVLSSVQTNETPWTEVPQPFPYKRWQGNVTLRKKDGSESTVRSKMTQILDEAGETIALIGICLNGFERQEPRSSPPPPQDPVIEDKVLTSITDDLKAPLAAMLGYLEMALTIGADQAEPHQILSIKRVEALARRLYDSIAHHAEALEIEAGKFEIHKAPLQLTRILEQAVQDREREASLKKVTIAMGVSKGLPPIFMDGVQIERAVEILLSNAVDFSPLGGKVTVQPQIDGSMIVIAITWSGTSLSPEEVASLFDRRKRLRRGGEEINTVGLYVALHIATAHGGTIKVQTDPQQGTTMNFSIPM